MNTGIYTVHIHRAEERKKLVEKMWLSNKKGMSSAYKFVVQKQQTRNK